MTTAVPPRAVLASLDAGTLAAAVDGCRSWRQVLRALGLGSNRHVKQLRVLCEQWGVSHQHLSHRAPPDGRLRAVLVSAKSRPEAMSRLGYAEDSGSARATIREHAARLGLDLRGLTPRPGPADASLSLQPDLRYLRDAGAFLVAGAFALAGLRVSWPLEPAAYDLVVDRDGQLLRIQVKTSSRKVGASWTCSITRSEYADVAGGKHRVRYQPAEIDAFAIVDGTGEVYVIPIDDVAGLTNLSLRRYAAYRIPRLTDADVPDTAETESG